MTAVFDAEGCLEALVAVTARHEVPGSAFGLSNAQRMLLAELNFSAGAEHFHTNKTVLQSALSTTLRAGQEGFQWCQAGHSVP